jgi:Cytochrome oxidase complex assembly protein 1
MRNKSRRHPFQRRILSFATVAALSSTTGQAWLPQSATPALLSPAHHQLSASTIILGSTPLLPPDSTIRTTSSTRLYHSSPLRPRDNNNNSNDDGGFLGKLGQAAKSFLPKKWFGSEQEKAELARKQEVRDQVKGSMDEMRKGAPLGVRMMGKMVAPLMSNLASTMAESFAEQQRTTERLLEDAQQYIRNDPNVVNAMGTPIQLGAPFSQSSSMTSVNGKTQSRVELALNIAGSKRNGIARIMATDEGIAQLIVESGGKVFNVNLSSSKSRGGRYQNSFGGSGGSGGDDNIIEAEIIEKDTKR